MNFKNIKTKKYILGAVLAAFTLTGCNRDNVIELKPYNQISEDVAFQTKENIVLSVNGMYQAAQIGQYNNANPYNLGVHPSPGLVALCHLPKISVPLL